MAKNPDLDNSFYEAKLWQQEAVALRIILLDCGLVEEIKWRSPCYTYGGKNICIIQRMKEFLALMFFKGAILNDPDSVLEPQGPNSRVGFRIRFASVQEVSQISDSIKALVRNAIEVELAGQRVELATEIELPEELVETFKEDSELQAAFERLTLGRQRGYAQYFSSAKQSRTRVARIDRYRNKILSGKGYLER